MGLILHTADGGASWHMQLTPMSDSLRSIRMTPGGASGFAAGDRGLRRPRGVRGHSAPARHRRTRRSPGASQSSMGSPPQTAAGTAMPPSES